MEGLYFLVQRIFIRGVISSRYCSHYYPMDQKAENKSSWFQGKYTLAFSRFLGTLLEVLIYIHWFEKKSETFENMNGALRTLEILIKRCWLPLQDIISCVL